MTTAQSSETVGRQINEQVALIEEGGEWEIAGYFLVPKQPFASSPSTPLSGR